MMALKTCCSRTRRAINWVYWPPKSSTTTPPNSDLGLLLISFILASVLMWLLGYDQIQQFVRDINDLHNALAVKMSGNRRISRGEFDDLVLAGTSGYLELAAQLAIDLHRNLNFIFSGQFGVAVGQLTVHRPLEWPSISHISSAMCGVIGASIRVSSSSASLRISGRTPWSSGSQA